MCSETGRKVLEQHVVTIRASERELHFLTANNKDAAYFITDAGGEPCPSY